MRPYLLAYLLIASTSWAQSTPGDDIRLERIDSSSGLSHNSVYSLLQDRQGFMWIGTVDGLNRYDGHEFLVYRYDPSDPTSLSNNLVNVLFEDQGGSLWVGTEDGLNRFDRARDRFTRYSLLPDNPEAVQEIIHAIFEDRSGALWIGTSLGLFRYHPSQDRLSRLSVLDDHAFVRIQEDAEGNLWTLTKTPERKAFLNRLGPRQGLAQQLRLAGEWGLVSTFFIDRTGDFWLNPSGPARLERDVAYPSTLSSWRSVSWAILQGRNGNVWIGSGGEGLIRYDPTDQTFERILMDPSPDAYLGNYVRSLWEDQAGALWIGTQGGLYRYDPHRKPFAHWKHDASDPNTMSHNHVSAIYEATDGMLWIGTFGGGLNRIDRAAGTVTRYRHRKGDRTSLRHDVVWDIKGGNQGQLWLATSDGLCEYDPRRDRFIWHDLRLPSGDVRQHRVQFIERARDETLWIASHFGLYQYDPQTGEARVYGVTGDDRGPSHDYIEALLLDGDGILWIGTGTQHINKLDTATGAFTHYPLLTENGESLHSEGIWDIHLASSGHLWLGTGTGLTRFDPASEGFRHFYVQDGLPGSVVYAILEDDEGRLWLGTNKGIARFDDRLPSDRNFRQYDVLDGIGSTEFNRHSAFKNDRGELLFGGMDGLTTFFPDAIRDNPYAPPVVLTRLERYNADGVLAIDPTATGSIAGTRRTTKSFDTDSLTSRVPGSCQLSLPTDFANTIQDATLEGRSASTSSIHPEPRWALPIRASDWPLGSMECRDLDRVRTKLLDGSSALAKPPPRTVLRAMLEPRRRKPACFDLKNGVWFQSSAEGLNKAVYASKESTSLARAKKPRGLEPRFRRTMFWTASGVRVHTATGFGG